MIFFLFRKSHIFWLFLFSKKFIISHEKIKKQTPPKLIRPRAKKLINQLPMQEAMFIEHLRESPLDRLVMLKFCYIHGKF